MHSVSLAWAHFKKKKNINHCCCRCCCGRIAFCAILPVTKSTHFEGFSPFTVDTQNMHGRAHVLWNIVLFQHLCIIFRLCWIFHTVIVRSARSNATKTKMRNHLNLLKIFYAAQFIAITFVYEVSARILITLKVVACIWAARVVEVRPIANKIKRTIASHNEQILCFSNLKTLIRCLYAPKNGLAHDYFFVCSQLSLCIWPINRRVQFITAANTHTFACRKDVDRKKNSLIYSIWTCFA